MHHYWYTWLYSKTLQQAFSWYKLSESCRRDSCIPVLVLCQGYYSLINTDNMSADAYLLGAVGILTQAKGWGKALEEGLLFTLFICSVLFWRSQKTLAMSRAQEAISNGLKMQWAKKWISLSRPGTGTRGWCFLLVSYPLWLYWIWESRRRCDWTQEPFLRAPRVAPHFVKQQQQAGSLEKLLPKIVLAPKVPCHYFYYHRKDSPGTASRS